MCLFAQSGPTLCDPVDCSPPGSSVHGDSHRQEYWNRLPCPPLGDLPNPGREPRSPSWKAEPPGKPKSPMPVLISIPRLLFTSPVRLQIASQWRGFPDGTSGKESICQCRRSRDINWFLGWEDPLKKEMATHSSILFFFFPVFLPGKSCGQMSLVGYSPWGRRAGHDWAHTAQQIEIH